MADLIRVGNDVINLDQTTLTVLEPERVIMRLQEGCDAIIVEYKDDAAKALAWYLDGNPAIPDVLEEYGLMLQRKEQAATRRVAHEAWRSSPPSKGGESEPSF